MVNEYNTLQILRIISKDNTISQPTIAKEVEFSLGKVNYILKALIEKGFIKTEKFVASNNKSKYKYILTQNGMKQKIDLTKDFIKRKKQEYEELQRELQRDGVDYASS